MLEAVVSVALRAIAISVVLGAVLAALVFLATRLLALTATTRHALWTTAMVAMAAMPLAGVGMSVSRALVPDTAPRHVAAVVRTHAAPASRARPHASSSLPVAAAPSLGERLSSAVSPPRLTRQIAAALVALWAAGALIGLAGLAMSVLRVRALRRRSSPLDGELANELPWLTEAGPGREIYLRLSYETETPVAIGFRRPVILIPTELATADGLAAIESLILHEHAHLRRYDDWTNLVQRTIERIFWFNPLVWIVGRRIALEREIASDDAVVEKTGAAKEYATSLWRLAREMRMPEHTVVAPGALLTRKQISVRIEQLLDANRARLHRSPAASLGVATAAVFAVVLVATSSPAIELPAAADPLVAVSPPVTAIAQVGASLRPRAVVAPHAQPSAAAENRVRKIIVIADAPSARRAVPSLPPPPSAPADAGLPPVHEHLAAVSRSMVASCVGCSFRNADLHGVDLSGLSIAGNDFRGADLRGANLSGTKLSGDSLVDADLSGANLTGAELSGVELGGAKFDRATLNGVRLVGADLTRVTLRDVALRDLLLNCVGCDLGRMDLHGQDLHGLVLKGADLARADLHDANLRGAQLTGIDFSHANLAGADLTDAHLKGCDLSGADLHGARTTGLVLTGSGLDG